MALTINTNPNSLSAQQKLARSTDEQAKFAERLSSGLRINRASDDSASLSVAASLSVKGRVYSQGLRNINDAISLLSVGEGALEQLAAIAERQSELAEQAASGAISLSQRKALNTEANALVDEFNRVVATTHFNGTNVLDLSVSDVRVQAGFSDSSSVNLQLNTELDRLKGTGSFGSSVSVSLVGDIANAFVKGDFNGDGNEDILYTSSTSTKILAFLGNGNGTFGAALTATAPSTSISTARLSVGDFNADGRDDLIAASSGAGNTYVYLANSDGTFGAGVSFFSNGANAIITADINGDSKLDVIRTSPFAAALMVNLGNGNGTFSGTTINLTEGTNASALSATDLNGDGVLDFVTSHSTGQIGVYISNGNGYFKAEKTYTNITNGQGIFTGDFNSDGYADVATAHSGATEFAVLLGNGDGSFQAYTSYANALNSGTAFMSDFNNDGYLDFASNSSSSVTVTYGNGDGTFTSSATSTISTTSTIAGIGDFNKDGVTDLANYNVNVGTLLLGSTTTTTTLQHVNITSQAGARSALSLMDSTRDRISLELGKLGSYQSRLSSALNSLGGLRENTEAAHSRIVDIDVAEESAGYLKNQIMQQAITAVLAQANVAPQIALQLLQ